MKKVLLAAVMSILFFGFLTLAIIAIDGGEVWAYIAMTVVIILSLLLALYLNHNEDIKFVGTSNRLRSIIGHYKSEKSERVLKTNRKNRDKIV